MTAFSAEDYVYLDWAATAPLCEEAARAMAPFLVPGRVNVALGANANSLHSPGRAAFAALEDARRSLARDLHAARASEIVLTSGATEADNAAVLGLARAAVDARRQAGCAVAVPHVVTTAVEHEAVLEPVRVLERAGYRVTRLAPDARGFVQAGALADAVDGDTVLVSVQMANSEVGSIQPVADLAQIAHEAGALFHTDATQALGKMPVDLAALGVDAASFSAHKVGGPKGVGALYLRARTPFSAQLLGGGQEDARRSGTQNVCGAAGFAAACHAACASGEEESARQRALRDRLYAELRAVPAWRPRWTFAREATSFCPTSCTCWWRAWKARRSSCASTPWGSGFRAGRPVRRAIWGRAMCCRRSACRATGRTAPCASRWAA